VKKEVSSGIGEPELKEEEEKSKKKVKREFN
jgi:hypothetical protein